MEPPWDGGTKVCSNDPGNKMAALPLYGKNLKLFVGTKWPISLELGIQHQALEYYKVCSNDDPRLTFDILCKGQLTFPYAFVWENT